MIRLVGGSGTVGQFLKRFRGDRAPNACVGGWVFIRNLFRVVVIQRIFLDLFVCVVSICAFVVIAII